MNGLKKYIPYAAIIFGVFLIVPAIFRLPALVNLQPVALYVVMLLTQVGCSALFCAKHGLDFLFALFAPIAFLFSMLIYYGGFSQFTNIVLLIVYLVAGIFGLFLGDLAFGDERRKKEKKEQEEVEELLLQAKRRDEREIKKMVESEKRQQAQQRYRSGKGKSAHGASRQTRNRGKHSEENVMPAAAKSEDDDFDYEKYMADIDKLLE